MNIFKSSALLAALSLAALNPVSAADYPSKAINLVVGFSAGGGTDTYARNLAASLPKYLNDQPIVVVNKSGGAQVPAMKVLKGSKSDGYSAMLVSMGSAIIATGLRDRGVDILKDFELVAQIGVNNVMLASSLESGFKTPADLLAGIKKAHAAGKKLRWGHAGRASITSLAVIAWLNKNGVYEMTQDVPFKGGSKVRVALIGNNVDFGGLGLSNAAGGYDTKLNVIGTFSDRRDPALPQYPTLGDLKTPYVAMETPLVFTVPKGTPKDIIAKLQTAIEKATQDADFKARAKKSGQAVVYRNSDEVNKFAAKLKSEWSATIKVVRERIAAAK
ncbi:MAG: tripartite-type tricarboxylate transporter receptor subunit TctC [Gammaproteobacteria bacterium]|jgi:tripartite-type tricarboxylate transporter receptor subunit TctC